MAKYHIDQIEESDYITGNKFIKLCDKYNIVFSKTDYVLEGLNELISRKDNPKIFVTHQSDYSITKECLKYIPENIKYKILVCTNGFKGSQIFTFLNVHHG